MGTTEEAAQVFWKSSLAWKRIPGFVEGVTVDKLFRDLEPLYTHQNPNLARQAKSLSDMIVKFKVNRNLKPRKRPDNLVRLPVEAKQKTIAA